MTTYIAWDGNEYPLPVPDGWYLGSDDRWWPEGHGPGPAAAAPAAPAGFADLPSAAPPPGGLPSAAPPAGSPTDWSSSDQTIYSSPPPGSGGPAPTGAPAADEGGNGKRFAILAAVLVGLIAIGAAAFFALGGDDEEGDATTATSVPVAEQPVAGDATATTAAPAGGDEGAETTAAPVEVAPGRGSIDDPYAVGEVIVLEYEDIQTGEQRVWNIEVLEPVTDITQATLDENQFNDPPEGEAIFAGARLRVTYVSGPAPASLFELTFKAVGPSGVVLTTFDPSCGVIPDELDTFAELFAGGTVEGNVCWQATPADAADLTLIIEGFLVDSDVYADLGG